MGTISSKIASLGLTLPGPIKLPPGVVLPFRFVNVRARRLARAFAGLKPTLGSAWPHP